MITVTLRPDHGDPIEVTAGTRDVYMWEKTTKGKTFSQFQESPSIADFYEITWHAVRRQGLFTGSFNEFVAAYELEAEGEDEGQPGPFPQAPSDVQPSGSRSKPASRQVSGSTKAQKR